MLVGSLTSWLCYSYAPTSFGQVHSLCDSVWCLVVEFCSSAQREGVGCGGSVELLELAAMSNVSAQNTGNRIEAWVEESWKCDGTGYIVVGKCASPSWQPLGATRGAYVYQERQTYMYHSLPILLHFRLRTSIVALDTSQSFARTWPDGYSSHLCTSQSFTRRASDGPDARCGNGRCFNSTVD